MKSVFVLNDPPYGTERNYNALRPASALLKKDVGAGVTVFLMADAVISAKAGQKDEPTRSKWTGTPGRSNTRTDPGHPHAATAARLP